MAFQDKLKPLPATSTPQAPKSPSAPLSFQAKLKPIKEPEPSLGEKLTGRYKQAVGGAAEEAKKLIIGKETNQLLGMGRMVLRPVGALGGAVGDVVGAGISAITPDSVEKKVEEVVTPVIEPVAKPLGAAFGKLKEVSPDVAQDVADVANATNLVVGGGTNLVKKPLGTAIKNTAEGLSEAGMKNVDEFAKRQVDNLIGNSKALQNKVAVAEQRGVPIRDLLADPAVFKGIKVKSGSIVPDDAIATLDNRIETLLNAKADVLPIMDRELPKVKREVVREKAVASVRGRSSPADEADLIAAINRQVDALPEAIDYSTLDRLRAQFRTSARDARGLQKRNSEYTALENATRDIMFDSSDRLPFDTGGEYAALNNDIKQQIATREFLETTLRGQKVRGGRLGPFLGRIVGGVAGSGAGIFGSIVGQEMGASIAKIVMNNSLGSSLKMQLIRRITDNPEALRRAAELVEKTKDYKQPLLSAPAPGAPRSVINGLQTIVLPKRDTNLRTSFPAGTVSPVREP